MEKYVKTSRISPLAFPKKEYCQESFENNKTFPGKRNDRLPAMGWNSWNAFGSANTEELTRIMADKLVELELDKLGYEYVVLDDGCYYPERVDGRLKNEPVKFPGGFKALSDYIHSKNLKFGMYNDIGTNLCAGSSVGTCGFEDLDAKSYVEWDIDFLKVDNCYYLWDNATFSNPENARFTYAPAIKSIEIEGNGVSRSLDASSGRLTGRGAVLEGKVVSNLGTYDGTNVGNTPVGAQSSELQFDLDLPKGEYNLYVNYATGKEPSIGEWLTVSVGEKEEARRIFDGLLKETQSKESFVKSEAIKLTITSENSVLRLMNHRRQENVLLSYGAMYNALQEAKKEASSNRDILLSICEWGKTMPHNWGYKVGDSWRILNDITFQVGSPENPGKGSWTEPGTTSITSQYDKAVVMDEFAGLDKGWNDPDMMVIGLRDVTLEMSKTHMAMWCMMNSPLMLGMDLRKVEKGDDIWKIIANKGLIALNQDALGVQAKRVYCSLEESAPDKTYITNHDRVDILAKPLSNGDVAVSFINLKEEAVGEQSIDFERVVSFLGDKMVNEDAFSNAKQYTVTNLFTDESFELKEGVLKIEGLEACGNATFRISAK